MKAYEFECQSCKTVFVVYHGDKPRNLSCPGCACEGLNLLSYHHEKSLNRLMQIVEMEARILTIEHFLKNNFEDFSQCKVHDWGM